MLSYYFWLGYASKIMMVDEYKTQYPSVNIYMQNV